MAGSCGKCSGPLAFGFGEIVRLPNGNTMEVCRTCADSMGRGPAPGGSAPTGMSPQAAPFASPPRRSSGGLVVALILALLLLVAGAGVFAWLRATPASPTPTAVLETETAAPPVAVAPDEDLAQKEADAWNGSGQFHCAPGMRINLKDKKANGQRSVVRADGDCQLTIIDCELNGSPALDVRDTARVAVNGGKMSGGAHDTVRVWPGARLVMNGTAIDGDSAAVRVDERAQLMLTNVTIKDRPRDPNQHVSWPSGIVVDDGAVVGIDGSSIEWLRQGLAAKGTSLVVLRNTKLSATVMAGERATTAALHLSGGATAMVVGGELVGPEVALFADDSAAVRIEGVKLTGQAKTFSNATMARSADAANADKSLDELIALARESAKGTKAEYERIQSYARSACVGVVECYKDSGFLGAVNCTVTTTIDAAGKASSISTQGVPASVAPCIRSLVKDKTIAGFEGPPGKQVCRFSGTLMAGGQILSVNSDYVKTK